MYGARSARARRFSLLLLEEEEEYVQDWVVTAAWPVDRVAGNWHRPPLVAGRLRLCTRSLFFEPDDVRVPIVRIPLAAVKSLNSGPPVATVAAQAAAAAASTTPSISPSGHPSRTAYTPSVTSSVPSLMLDTREVVLMRANMEEVPYTFLRAGGDGGGGAMGVGGDGNTISNKIPVGFVWAFGPCYSPLQPLLLQAGTLLEIHRRPREQRNAALEELSRQRMDAVSFDLSRLVDFGERLVWSGPVVALTPLVREHGHLAITPIRVYFQPLHNIAGDTPVKSHPLAAVAAVARRRSSLRPVGLELFFLHPTATAAATATSGNIDCTGTGGGSGGRSAAPIHRSFHPVAALGPLWDAPSAFFAFRCEADREAARHLLTIQPELGRCVPRRPSSTALQQQSKETGAGAGRGDGLDPLTTHGLLLEAAGPWLRRVTAAWQRGAITNFDYLLYLNFAAGRSFNDLAQWPVFPWVLQNYISPSLDLNDPGNFRDLSKPIGALNATRLEELRQRFRDMPHDSFEGSIPPFLYGTHYSSPGYVMYWLVRAAPSHMLRLQNGRFDAPDRLFASVQEAWEGVLHSTTDVKELIPEFFMPGWDFLINHRRLPLGVRQSGRPVDNVVLPPWATDPRDFLAKNRAALESPAVSAQLHAWIDLIFGYKQCGEAAEAADNVFYYLTYEGAVDVAAVTSPVELKALETQINEFGQTPKQLFTTPHPPRLVCPPAPDPATVFLEDRGEAGSGGQMPASATAGASSGTGYGSEGDAGNRDLALALLSTIMAAAAPEYGMPALATTVVGCSDGEPQSSITLQGPAEAMEGLPAPAQQPRAGTSVPATAAAAAASMISGFLKLGRYQQHQHQRQQEQQGEASSDASVPAQAPAATAGALFSQAVKASAPATVAGAASALLSSLTSAFHHPAAGISGGTGAGLVGSAGKHVTCSTEPPNVSHSELVAPPDTCLAGPANPTLGAVAAAAITEGYRFNPTPNGTNDSPCDTACNDSSKGRTLVSGGAADWGWGALCTTPFRAVAWSQLTRGSLAAVASGRNGYLYCAGQSGIRVVTEPTAGSSSTPASDGAGMTVVRSAQLEGELLSLALLQTSAGPSAAATAGAAQRHNRLVLLGSHNRKVYAYLPDSGRVVGSFEAHDDAVCCVQLTAAAGVDGESAGGAPSSTTLVTSSWDCSVKIWSLAEGRAPWSTGLSLATTELRDFESGVWALATDPWGGPLLVTGTEEGVVALWDTRAPGRSRSSGAACRVWQAPIADDYVGGVALIPAGGGAGAEGGAPVKVLAATADGALTLYDIRTGGGGMSCAQRLAVAACGAPLRCCAADSRAAVAGEESGVVRVWDVGLMAGGTEAVRPGGPEPDGLYPGWGAEETGGAALCGLDIYMYPYSTSDRSGSRGGADATVRLAVVTEGGRLVVLESESGCGAGGP